MNYLLMCPCDPLISMALFPLYDSLNCFYNKKIYSKFNQNIVFFWLLFWCRQTHKCHLPIILSGVILCVIALFIGAQLQNVCSRK